MSNFIKKLSLIIFGLSVAASAVDSSVAEKFSSIYEQNVWNGGSGPGSFYDNTHLYRAKLQEIFDQSDIKSIVDVGCGDWQYMRHMRIPNETKYKGYDVVSSVIEKNRDEFTSSDVEFLLYDGDFSTIPSADLCIIKDVLQHLSNERINQFVEQLTSRKFKYVLITNCYKSDDPFYADKFNQNIEDGEWRPLDLTLPPFNLRMQLILEYQGGGNKRAYLWTAE